MTTALVYCTDQVLPTLNQFLYVSLKDEAAKGVRWSVIQNGGQSQMGETSSPTKFFYTGFYQWHKDWLDDEQQRRLPYDKEQFCSSVYAIVDRDSVENETVELRSLITEYSNENIEYANPQTPRKSWNSWRVDFEDAPIAVLGLLDSPTQFIENKNKKGYRKKNGAFDVKKALEIDQGDPAPKRTRWKSPGTNEDDPAPKRTKNLKSGWE